MMWGIGGIGIIVASLARTLLGFEGLVSIAVAIFSAITLMAIMYFGLRLEPIKKQK